MKRATNLFETDMQDLEEEVERLCVKPLTAQVPLDIPFPGRDRIFLLFELDGDKQDPSANQFEFNGPV